MNLTLRRYQHAAWLATTLSVVGCANLAQATSKSWDGWAATCNWADAPNWNADGVPTSNDAVVLDNSVVNPLPQISALSGASCGTLTLDGTVSGNFLSYAWAKPYVLSLYSASVNAATVRSIVIFTDTYIDAFPTPQPFLSA